MFNPGDIVEKNEYQYMLAEVGARAVVVGSEGEDVYVVWLDEAADRQMHGTYSKRCFNKVGTYRTLSRREDTNTHSTDPIAALVAAVKRVRKSGIEVECKTRRTVTEVKEDNL